MFSMLSGIRLNSSNRPYLGSISSNLNPHGFGRPPGRYHSSTSGNRTGSNTGNASRMRSRGPFGSLGEGGKVQTLEIVLDKDSKPVFEPGQEVTGRLVLVCGGTLRFRSLSVSMKGMARVHWTEARATGNRLGAYREQFNAEMEYFNKKRYLVNANSNGDRHVVSEGRHEFEFRFQLPSTNDIATSFEGRFGSVRYFIRADLDQSWAYTHRTKRAFTVISPIDINTEEQQTPVVRETEKTVCCWMCSSGEVSMTVATDRKGYCPGESVAIDASFCNRSSRRVHPEAVLCQTQTFTAGGKTRSKRTKFTVLSGRAVAGGKDDTWDAMLLKIPPVSPSIANCRLIKVEYAVKVSLIIPGSYSLSVLLPIVIGTVPYRRPRPPTSSLPSPRAPTISEPAPPYIEARIFEVENDLPPSYMECFDAEEVDLVEAEDISDTSSLYGETRFAPLYRYVTDYQYQPPPAYSEVDPFPYPVSSGSRVG